MLFNDQIAAKNMQFTNKKLPASFFSVVSGYQLSWYLPWTLESLPWPTNFWQNLLLWSVPHKCHLFKETVGRNELHYQEKTLVKVRRRRRVTVTNCRTFREAAFHWLLPSLPPSPSREELRRKCHKNYLQAGLQRHRNCRFGSLELPKLLLWTMLITNTRYLTVKTVNLTKSFANTGLSYWQPSLNGWVSRFEFAFVLTPMLHCSLQCLNLTPMPQCLNAPMQ